MDQNLKERLDFLSSKYNVNSFVDNDPVQFPRRFDNVRDIEIAGLITSVISWGKREMILRNANRILDLMNHSPYAFIMNREWTSLKDSDKNLHRTFFERDLHQISQSLYDFYKSDNSLEIMFESSVIDGLTHLSGMMQSRHIASPARKSPCKRTNLFLRWMVRKDGIVDMGVWNKINPADLIIPLDVHVGRTSRTIWKDIPSTDNLNTAQIITANLKQLRPEDPCLYDFALFGLGVEGMR